MKVHVSRYHVLGRGRALAVLLAGERWCEDGGKTRWRRRIEGWSVARVAMALHYSMTGRAPQQRRLVLGRLE